MKIPFKRSKKGITLQVKVEPRASQRGISGLFGEALKVKVNAAPAEGEANKELIEILSEEFGIKKTAVRIIKGHSSRNKIVEIEGVDSIP